MQIKSSPSPQLVPYRTMPTPAGGLNRRVSESWLKNLNYFELMMVPEPLSQIGSVGTVMIVVALVSFM